MQLRNLAPATQPSDIHYVAEFAPYFHRSPEQLDLEAVRQLLCYGAGLRVSEAVAVKIFVSVL